MSFYGYQHRKVLAVGMYAGESYCGKENLICVINCIFGLYSLQCKLKHCFPPLPSTCPFLALYQKLLKAVDSQKSL